MKKWIVGAALVAGLAALSNAAVFAHSGATGVVKQRMDLMDSLGKTTERLTAMMRGKTPYDAAAVREMAKIIGGHGGENLTRLFPEGSIRAPSEAVPEIWKDWDRFNAIANDLQAYARALEKAAGNPRAHSGGGGMPPPATMGGGMMGSGPAPGGMMGDGMMADSNMGPSPDQLASMPPNAAFFRVLGACTACHQDFRQKK